MRLARIVSGGQTGADQGGWDAAIYCDMPYGGWVPKGRRSENGEIPPKYGGCRETTSANYIVRNEANVADSDATVIFCYGPPTGGSAKTATFARKHRRPYLVADLSRPRREIVDQVVRWILDRCPDAAELNVAGSRESTSPGIQSAVRNRMIDVISKVNGKLFYPLPDTPPPEAPPLAPSP